jgi:hypothetical protein
MSFGNSGNIDNSSYSLDGGLGNFGNTGFESVPVEGFKTDSNGYEIYPDWVTEGISQDDYGNSSGGRNWGSLINTLGRLGTGLLGGAADYSANSNQQNYLPYIKWLGHGLADFGALNNASNKQQALNNAYGNTLMLSSLFGRGFGRKRDTIDPLPKDVNI